MLVCELVADNQLQYFFEGQLWVLQLNSGLFPLTFPLVFVLNRNLQTLLLLQIKILLDI